MRAAAGERRGQVRISEDCGFGILIILLVIQGVGIYIVDESNVIINFLFFFSHGLFGLDEVVFSLWLWFRFKYRNRDRREGGRKEKELNSLGLVDQQW